MKKVVPAANPDAYVAALSGWRRDRVVRLRTAVHSVAGLDERIKWGHIVCFSNGPLLLIRAEEARVLFGFWRGKRLRDIEPRLKPGGKYELATFDIREDTKIDFKRVPELVREAVALNARLGNPAERHEE
ncbi:DUF1801 domain-containing protein [Pendulispora rubella]|uniref:DUF1801 domain-containing protein n=1 Tax=Pendulispora rubella TaxID=2741070 RepID=A0ABZ2L154_9BACT